MNKFIPVASKLIIQQIRTQNPKVEIVAASKTQSEAKILELHNLGINHFGENYFSESKAKICSLRKTHPQLVWHYIGRIQNKFATKLFDNFDIIQTVCEMKTLLKWEQYQKDFPEVVCPNWYIQVSWDANENRGGVHHSKLKDLLYEASKLEIFSFFKGIMVLPPASSSVDELKRIYSEARSIKDNLEIKLSLPSLVLSAGMSQDYEIAINHGSTMVRLGEVLFGQRTK